MLALHSRRRRHAVPLGVLAGAISGALLLLYWAVAILSGVDLGLPLILGTLWTVAAPVLALTLPVKGMAPVGGRSDVNPIWSVVAAAVLLVTVALPTLGLQSCGPALGLPEAPRHFTPCIPFSA